MSEMFLAEAAVAVIPDLTLFRAKLIKDLETATAGVVANVKVAATGATTAAAAATKAGGGAAQAAAAGTQTATVSTRALAEANDKLAAAVKRVELAEKQVLATDSAIAAQRIRLTAATRAVTINEEAFAAALRSGNGATIVAAAEALGLSRTREAEALSALEAARAENALTGAREKGAAAASAQRAFVARGFASQALAAAGLRGAVLSANAAFLAGTVAAVGFFKAVQSAAQIETELAVFAVQAGATADEMQRVSETARQLGADLTLPGVNATDAAQTLNELSKAGLSVNDSIGGARGVLQLATAAAISNAEATQLAASALNAFGLAGTEAAHVADVLTNAANASQGSITDIGLSLQQASAVSRQVGVSLEDTVALLTLLARNGIRGSDAGTSLRVAFTKLINPTAKARAILDQLNVQIRDMNGNIRPEVFADFAQAQSGLSRAQQDQNAGIVFGTDALRAYSIAAREGVVGLGRAREEIAKVGSAAELAAARTSGLAGSAENLKNQMATLGLAIGDMAKGPLKDFVDILAGGFANINSFIGFLERATGGAKEAKQSFAELAVEAGKINNAVAVRGDSAGQGLLDEQTKLNKALEESLGPGLEATRMVEGYRDALAAAAREAEGLSNRIDESFDRSARSPLLEPDKLGPKAIGPAARLAGDLATASAKGDLDAVLSFQKQQLADARRAFENSKGNVKQRTELYDKMRDAEAAVISTQRQISEQIASDRKRAATEAEQRAAQADRDVISGISRREDAAFDSREIRAEQTKRLSDDIALARDRKRFLLKQIEIVQKSVNDDELRVATIRELRNRRAKLTSEIEGLLRDQREAAALQAEQRRDAITERLGLLLQIAESRGGKDAILAALNNLISNARKRTAAAKKGSIEQLRERAALEDLLEQRREMLGEVEDAAKKGPTAFDLLTQFSTIFGETAGNLINGAQPFVGPSGFVADIAQFLKRTGAGGKAIGGTTGQTEAERNILKLDDTAIVTAMNALRDAFLGRRTTSGTSPVRRTPTSGAIDRNDARWREAGRARATIDSRRSGI